MLHLLLLAAMALLNVPRLRSQGFPQHVRTYRAGEIMYLESVNGLDTVRVGINSRWGGSIVDLSYRGKHFVNQYDHGREIQLALYGGEQNYDACGGCSGTFGWNPVQAGDRHGHDSEVLIDSIGVDFVYIKTRPIEWFPDNKGGSRQKAVGTSVTMEQWVSIANWSWRAIEVRYRITYTGSENHLNYLQELPAVYLNEGFDHFIHYAGSSPWTQQTVTDTILALPRPSRMLHTTEKWLTLADATGFGLTVFVPNQYPYSVGRFIPGKPLEKRFATVFYRPMVTQSWIPGRTVQDEYYLIPGQYKDARDLLYKVHDRVGLRDAVTPFGFLDNPRAGAVLSGQTSVEGWAIDNNQVARVEIYLDGDSLGAAEYGRSRQDIPRGPYRESSPFVGYRFLLDTRRLPNGPHLLDVWVVDVIGNRAFYGNVSVTVQNLP